LNRLFPNRQEETNCCSENHGCDDEFLFAPEHASSFPDLPGRTVAFQAAESHSAPEQQSGHIAAKAFSWPWRTAEEFLKLNEFVTSLK
jgi:hypothetical protein